MSDSEYTEAEEVIIEFYNKLAKSQQELEPEIARVIYDKLWELYLD